MINKQTNRLGWFAVIGLLVIWVDLQQSPEPPPQAAAQAASVVTTKSPMPASTKSPMPASTKTPMPDEGIVLMPVDRPANLRAVTGLPKPAMLNTTEAVTWATEPECMVIVPTIPTLGKLVTVKTGPCAGSYWVYGYQWQPTNGGKIPKWMPDGDVDLVLITMTKSAGTNFTLAQA